MSTAVVFFFGLILLVGVILVIVGRGTDKRRQKVNVTMPSSEMHKLPDKFDPDFIQKRLAEVQNSPNVLVAYAEALMMRFQSSAEKLALRGMMSKYKTLTGIIEAEKDVYKATTDRNEAKTGYEISADPEVKQLKKEDKIVSFEESIATKKTNISNLKMGKDEHEVKLEEYRKIKDLKKGKHDIDREYEIYDRVEDAFKETTTQYAIEKTGNHLRSKAYGKHANGEITDAQLKKELEDIDEQEERALDRI